MPASNLLQNLRHLLSVLMLTAVAVVMFQPIASSQTHLPGVDLMGYNYVPSAAVFAQADSLVNNFEVGLRNQITFSYIFDYSISSFKRDSVNLAPYLQVATPYYVIMTLTGDGPGMLKYGLSSNLPQVNDCSALVTANGYLRECGTVGKRIRNGANTQEGIDLEFVNLLQCISEYVQASVTCCEPQAAKQGDSTNLARLTGCSNVVVEFLEDPMPSTDNDCSTSKPNKIFFTTSGRLFVFPQTVTNILYMRGPLQGAVYSFRHNNITYVATTNRERTGFLGYRKRILNRLTEDPSDYFVIATVDANPGERLVVTMPLAFNDADCSVICSQFFFTPDTYHLDFDPLHIDDIKPQSLPAVQNYVNMVYSAQQQHPNAYNRDDKGLKIRNDNTLIYRDLPNTLTLFSSSTSYASSLDIPCYNGATLTAADFNYALALGTDVTVERDGSYYIYTSRGVVYMELDAQAHFNPYIWAPHLDKFIPVPLTDQSFFTGSSLILALGSASWDVRHFALAGISATSIPIISEAADVIDGVLYLTEGEYAEAGFAFSSAVVPLSLRSVQYAPDVLRLGGHVGDAAMFIFKNADGTSRAIPWTAKASLKNLALLKATSDELNIINTLIRTEGFKHLVTANDHGLEALVHLHRAEPTRVFDFSSSASADVLEAITLAADILQTPALRTTLAAERSATAAWRVALQHGDEIRRDTRFLKDLAKHNKEFSGLADDLSDPALFDAYKRIREDPRAGYELIDDLDPAAAERIADFATTLKAKDWWKWIERGRKFERNTVSANLIARSADPAGAYHQLRNAALASGKNLDDYDMYAQVQLLYNPAIDKYFVADQVFVKWGIDPSTNKEVIVDLLVIENKLQGTTALTTNQLAGRRAASLDVRRRRSRRCQLRPKSSYGNDCERPRPVANWSRS